jgi:hypothetical protein
MQFKSPFNGSEKQAKRENFQDKLAGLGLDKASNFQFTW